MKVKEIKNLYYKNVKINIRECDIELSKNSVIIECNEKISRTLDETFEIIDYLYCIGENDEKITLYDCHLALNESDIQYIRNFKLIYNKILIGEYVDDYENMEISELECVFDNSILTYQISIGNSYFNINDYEIHTEWNIVNNKCKGIKLTITPMGCKKKISELIDILNNILCILFFEIGYFPNERKIYVINDNYKYEFLNPNKSIYRTSKNIEIEGRLKKELYKNINDSYKKWCKLYEDNKVLFHIFFDAQDSSTFEEVKTFNYIQCLESLFANNIFEKTFSDKYKEDIKQLLKEQINPNKKNKLIRKLTRIIKHIRACGVTYDIDDFNNSLQGKLNNINEMSLSKEIKEIFNNKYAQKIFEYEKSNNLIKIIQKKTYNHRNFVAHINNKNNYFIGDENHLIQKKFKLLFRLVVLEIIDIEVNEEQLTKYIDHINLWYKNNTIKKISPMC